MSILQENLTALMIDMPPQLLILLCMKARLLLVRRYDPERLWHKRDLCFVRILEPRHLREGLFAIRLISAQSDWLDHRFTSLSRKRGAIHALYD